MINKLSLNKVKPQSSHLFSPSIFFGNESSEESECLVLEVPDDEVERVVEVELLLDVEGARD